MSRRPPKTGDKDDHIGRPREEDKPRGSPRRGGCWECFPMEIEERLLDNHAWMWNKTLSIIYHPRGCKICMEYGWYIMEAELMKDNDYIVACKGRKEEANFWWMKANKYTDLLEDADENVHYLKQWVMKLEQEIEKGSDYKKGHQGKRARYNAPTEEMLMNTSNNKQALTVREPLEKTTHRCYRHPHLQTSRWT